LEKNVGIRQKPRVPEARSEGDPKKASRLEARHARRSTGQKRGMPEGMKKARKPDKGQKA
jgi:hypothetical protein